MNEFNLFENLPFIVFGLAFTVALIIFLFGAFGLLSRNIEKIEKSERTLIKSFYGFFIVLLIMIVFFFGSWLLNSGEVFKPPHVPGEFPPSPVSSNFPSLPVLPSPEI